MSSPTLTMRVDIVSVRYKCDLSLVVDSNDGPA